eukprot:4215838-Pyramimonas_sp.AAC.1
MPSNSAQTLVHRSPSEPVPPLFTSTVYPWTFQLRRQHRPKKRPPDPKLSRVPESRDPRLIHPACRSRQTRSCRDSP